jgi:hypothetical protein
LLRISADLFVPGRDVLYFFLWPKDDGGAAYLAKSGEKRRH